MLRTFSIAILSLSCCVVTLAQGQRQPPEQADTIGMVRALLEASKRRDAGIGLGGGP